jgi:hypothetical protein
MGLFYQPNLVMDGLAFGIDAVNIKSYSGTGLSWYDISGFGVTGTLNNGTSFYTTNGGVMGFDGTNDYVNTGYINLAQDSSTSFTWNSWIWNQSSSTNVIIGNRANLPHFTKLTPSAFEFYGSPGISYTMPRYSWKNICIVKNASTFTYFVDGVSVASSTGATTKNATPVYLGGDPGIGEYFNGYIANVFIYNRNLSSDEVMQNYHAHKSRFIYSENIVSSGLTLNFDFGSGASYPKTGSYVSDVSGNNNFGTLNNGPIFSGTGTSSYLIFDGVDDNVSVSHSSGTAPGNNITFGVMFQSSSVSGTIVVAGKQAAAGGAASYAIVIQNNRLYSRISNGTTEYNASMPFANTSSFNYAVGTYDGSSLKLYHNGLLVDSTSVSITITYSASYSFYIGSYGSVGFPMRGYINSVQLYNRTLTANEIKQNFDIFKTRFGLTGTGTTNGVEVPL